MPCWIWDFLFSLEKKVVVVDPCLIDPWHQKKSQHDESLENRKDLLRKAKSVWIFILDHQCFKSPATYIYLSSFATIIISRKIQWWDGWITEKSPVQLVNYQTSTSFSWILCLPFCGSHDVDCIDEPFQMSWGRAYWSPTQQVFLDSCRVLETTWRWQ